MRCLTPRMASIGAKPPSDLSIQLLGPRLDGNVFFVKRNS